MIKTKALSALLFLSAAVATPVYAQDARVLGQTDHDRSNYRHAHNELVRPVNATARRNKQNFGFSAKDRSRVGGWSPSLKPAD